MTELFPVHVRGSGVPASHEGPVVFHGANKSGSLAMSEVIRDAYRAEGRLDQFVSTYHREPQSLEDFAVLLGSATDHAFFVSHYIYRRMALPSHALLTSQVRHPIPRVLSVYGWLQRGHLRKRGTLDGFPNLRDWILRTQGTHHTQMVQFAVGFAEDRRDAVNGLRRSEIRDIALENLHTDFAWFGVAEFFEESIYAMAHMCGLKAVPPWAKDVRNSKRPRLADTDDRTVELIRQVFEYEIEFYEAALVTFKKRMEHIDFGPSIDEYKERCSNEYGERLIAAS